MGMIAAGGKLARPGKLNGGMASLHGLLERREVPSDQNVEMGNLDTIHEATPFG